MRCSETGAAGTSSGRTSGAGWRPSPERPGEKGWALTVLTVAPPAGPPGESPGEPQRHRPPRPSAWRPAGPLLSVARSQAPVAVGEVPRAGLPRAAPHAVG